MPEMHSRIRQGSSASNSARHRCMRADAAARTSQNQPAPMSQDQPARRPQNQPARHAIPTTNNITVKATRNCHSDQHGCRRLQPMPRFGTCTRHCQRLCPADAPSTHTSAACIGYIIPHRPPIAAMPAAVAKALTTRPPNGAHQWHPCQLPHTMAPYQCCAECVRTTEDHAS
jgi:hypothetical protein